MSGSLNLLRNAGWLTAQSLATSAVSVVVTALVARYLGTEQYGVLALMISVNAIMLTLASLGLRSYGVREIAAGRRPAGELVGEMVMLRFALSLGGAAIAIGIFAWLAPMVGPAMLALLGITLVGNALGLCFIDGLYGVEQFRSVAVVMAFSALAVQLVSLLAVFLQWGLTGVACAYAIGGIVMALVGLGKFRRHVGAPHLTWPTTRMLDHVRQSRMWFALNIVGTLQARADLLVVTWVAGSHEAGLYGSSQALVQKVDLLHDGLTTALFPRIADLHGHSPDEMRELVRSSMRITLLLALPIAIGLAALSDQVIVLLFGRDFAEAGIVLAVLALGIPFRFAYGVMFNVMGAMGRQSTLLRHALVAFAATLALMAFGASRMGAAGAAMAAVAGLAGLATSITIAYARENGAPLPGRDALALVGANIVLGAVIWATHRLALGWQVLIPMAAYAVVTPLLGLVSLAAIRAALARFNPFG